MRGQGSAQTAILFLFAALLSASACAAQRSADWPAYFGGRDGDHYSTLTQINRSNVQRLTQAWIFDTGESGGRDVGGLETNPLIVGRTLYAFTPTLKVIALDAATGKLKWKFDSGIDSRQPDRGLTYWTDGRESRLFAGIMNFLYCLDPETGKPIASFGEGGRIDLRKNLREPYQDQSIALTSPGVIYKDLIITGGRDPETHPAPPGDIRAYDVHTGALRWTFHTIPRPGEPAYGIWPPDAWKTAGAANNWSGMSLDAANGIVYVPTGSAVADFYGGDRVGNDLYADTLLALDAETGKLKWYFQGAHHDIWDRDFPSPPALYTLNQNGKTIEALAQTTKQGYLYLFNRLTGEPLYPIHEHPYPASTVPGEAAAPTQPMPDWPQPFVPQRLTADMLTNRTPEAHAWAAKEFSTLRNDGQFLPLAVNRQTIVFPGFDGGAEWGGPAIDRATDTLYVNANRIAATGGLAEVPRGAGVGERIYDQQCAVCHGTDRRGSPPAFPSLIDAGKRLSAKQITDTIRHGGGRMPAFPNLDEARLTALVNFVLTGSSAPSAAEPQSNGAESGSAKSGGAESGSAGSQPEQYVFTGYHKFLDAEGYPATAPPWGTLTAIDLKTGKQLWQIPLGEYPDLARRGMTDTGSENYGGPIVTAGGVLFIGATVFDHEFHAFDTRSGKLLWQVELPYSGVATPATYMIDGRQYVVIAASNERDPKAPQGAAYVAFALPK